MVTAGIVLFHILLSISAVYYISKGDFFMKLRKTALFLSCLMLISTAAANVSAAVRNEGHTNYEVSSEKFAARLKTIDGLKYSFDENGTPKGLYTGWALSLIHI